MNIELNSEIVKAQAMRLHVFVKEKCPGFKLSHAYHALAQIYGFKNWNTLSALIKREDI